MTAPALRVAVLLGGDTAEREISIKTGRAVAEALRAAGHAVDEIVLGDPLAMLNTPAFQQADVVFPALHGGAGEDGRIQALLELAGKPYAGAGPCACALSMDKVLTKRLCAALEVPTAEWVEVPAGSDPGAIVALAAPLGWPVVYKPVGEGSAVGVHILADAAQAERTLGEEARHEAAPRVGEGRWMLERYVPGRELTLPVLWEEPMAIVEIRPKEGFYDYRNKYTPGCSEYECPAALAPEVADRVTEAGMRLAAGMGLLEMCRIDVRLDPQDRVFVLEANSIPGMTSVSLLPMGAAARGYDFTTMCDRLCRRALERFRQGAGA